MSQRLITLILCGFLVLFAVLRAYADAPAAEITPATASDFEVPCQAALLMDEDSGAVLYEKNATEERPVASITKIMTLLLTFEALEQGRVKLDDLVPVSEHAYGMGGSQIWLEPGERFTLDEMLKAVCISSANDAAVAVAEFIGGSEPVFVEQMNQRAAELGMHNTHFANACGLDAEGHYSSAHDVALMSREMLLHHSEVRNYCSIWMDSLRGGQTQLVNTNKLLKSYNGITGLKTGTTGKAGVCISASAERDGLRLIAVVLGSSSGKERFRAASTLLDYGFAKYENVSVSLPEQAPQTLPVERGTAECVPLCYTAPGAYLMEKGQGSTLTTELDLPQKAAAPVAVATQLGAVHLYRDGSLLQSYPITAAESVDALSFGYCLERLLDGLVLRGTNFVQNS